MSADLTIVHPYDPWAPGVSGIDTWTNDFLRVAPAKWAIEVIGVTADPVHRPVGSWLERSYRDRDIRFYAALHEPVREIPTKIPLALRFALAARRRSVRSHGRILQFQRFECAYALRRSRSDRVVQGLFNDLTEQIVAPRTVRWHHLSGVFRKLVVSSWRRADGVVVAAPGMKAVVENRIRAMTPVLVVGEWADGSVFRPLDENGRAQVGMGLRRRLNWPPDARITVFGGRLEAHKGVDRMIAAAARLRHRPEFRLLVIGSGRQRRALGERAADLGLADRVRFLDPQSPPDLARIYASCDIGLCASERDAGPRFVLEALACGLPVVSTPVGQAVELVDDAVGRLLERGSSDELASAVDAVLDRSDLERMRLACLDRAAQRTPQAMLRPLFDLYESWLMQDARTQRHSAVPD